MVDFKSVRWDGLLRIEVQKLHISLIRKYCNTEGLPGGPNGKASSSSDVHPPVFDNSFLRSRIMIRLTRRRWPERPAKCFRSGVRKRFIGLGPRKGRASTRQPQTPDAHSRFLGQLSISQQQHQKCLLDLWLLSRSQSLLPTSQCNLLEMEIYAGVCILGFQWSMRSSKWTLC